MAMSTASWGKFGAVSAGAMLNLALSDEFAVRFAGKTLRRDSYVEGYWDPNEYDTRYLPSGVMNAAVISDNSYQGIGQTLTQRENWWIDAAGTNREAQRVRALTPADKADFYNNANEHSFRVSTLWEPVAGRFSNRYCVPIL